MKEAPSAMRILQFEFQYNKLVPISLSVSFNLIEELTFQWKFNRKNLEESFVDALFGLATQNKTRMKLKLLCFETNVLSKLYHVFSTLAERRRRTQPLMDHVDLQDHLERRCNSLWVFGCNSAVFDKKFEDLSTASLR